MLDNFEIDVMLFQSLLNCMSYTPFSGKFWVTVCVPKLNVKVPLIMGMRIEWFG